MNADTARAIHKRAIVAIASATGSTSLLVNVWLPFLPLYMLQVGAEDNAAALFWVAVGASAQGAGRLIGGPLWGLLSDRLGRKKMFIRAVYFAALTSFVLSIINAPWQVGIALGLQGLLSGFVPAAVALMSVSVPDARVRDGLNAVSGAQYLGSAIGPGVGAAMAIAFGYRGAIFTSGLLIAAVATDRLLSLYRQMAASKLGDANRYQELFKGMAFDRPATAEEIAWTVAFAASERSSYTTGVVITIDGGGAARS